MSFGIGPKDYNITKRNISLGLTVITVLIAQQSNLFVNWPHLIHTCIHTYTSNKHIIS